MRIFLVGYMGSGKTSLGRPLAGRLGMQFFDLDNSVAERRSCTIRDIFEREGEERFREIERDMLRELSLCDGRVISTGGGTPCFHGNMEFMNSCGITVYLKLSPARLAERLRHGADKRPLLRGMNGEELLDFISGSLASREEFYGKARIIVDCDGYGDEQIVGRIAEIIKLA